jgi:hypothetical protein
MYQTSRKKDRSWILLVISVTGFVAVVALVVFVMFASPLAPYHAVDIVGPQGPTINYLGTVNSVSITWTATVNVSFQVFVQSCGNNYCVEQASIGTHGSLSLSLGIYGYNAQFRIFANDNGTVTINGGVN